MKKMISILALITASSLCADVYVNGYAKRDGTFVQGYTRSSPNSTTSDNYSTRGNTNPYTGQAGTRSPSPSGRSANFGGESPTIGARPTLSPRPTLGGTSPSNW